VNLKLVALQTLLLLPTVARAPFERWIKGTKIDGGPIFIVGAPHSGTTIMLALLDSHSRLYAIPGSTCVGPTRLTPILPPLFNLLTLGNGKHRWVEKTNDNISHLDTLLSMSPDARVIIMLRDGRDVANSLFERTGSLTYGARRWISDNVTGRPHWDHPRVRVIKYEDLIADSVATLSEILEFVGEEFEEQCLQHHLRPRRYLAAKVRRAPDLTGSNFELHRNWQINQPLFDGRGRWRKTLSPEQLSVLSEEGVDELLAEYGYPPD